MTAPIITMTTAAIERAKRIMASAEAGVANVNLAALQMADAEGQD